MPSTKPDNPCVTLAAHLLQLTQMFGTLELSAVDNKHKYRLGEAILGMERIRTRLLSGAPRDSWREVVERDDRIGKHSGTNPA